MYLHRITLSAHASTFGGIVRPIYFAVFRLITSSNFVGLHRQSGGLGAFQGLSSSEYLDKPFCRFIRLILRAQIRRLALGE